MERRRTAVLRRSKFSNLARFHFLYRLKSHLYPRSNPVFYPVPMHVLALSFPILVPFLYCLAIISRCAPVAAQPLDHVGPSLAPRDQGEVCIHGKETLGTSLRNMFAPVRGSKGSGSVRKAMALGAPHAKKKRRLNGPDEKRGRGGGGDTQSQAPAVARRSQGQQEQPT